MRLAIKHPGLLFWWIILSTFCGFSTSSFSYEDKTHSLATKSAIVLIRIKDRDKNYAEIYNPEFFKYIVWGSGGEGGSAYPGEDYGYVMGNERSFRHYYNLDRTNKAGFRKGVPWKFYYPLWRAADGKVEHPGTDYFPNALEWARDGAKTFYNPHSKNSRNWVGAITAYDYTASSRREAYYRLGSVSHLVADMAEPDHAAGVPHSGSSFRDPVAIRHYGRPVRGFEKIVEDAVERIEIGPLFDRSMRIQHSRKDLDFFFHEVGKYSLNHAREEGFSIPLGLAYGVLPDVLEENAKAYLELARDLLRQSTPYNAGMIQLFYEIVNPPPYVLAVYIRDIETDQLFYQGIWQDILERNKGTHDNPNNADYIPKYDFETVSERKLEVSHNQSPIISGKEYSIRILFGPSKNQVVFDEAVNPDYIKVSVEDLPVQGSFKDYVWEGKFSPELNGDTSMIARIKISTKDLQFHYVRGRRIRGFPLDVNPQTPAKVGFNYPYKWNNYEKGSGMDMNHRVKISKSDDDEAFTKKLEIFDKGDRRYTYYLDQDGDERKDGLYERWFTDERQQLEVTMYFKDGKAEGERVRYYENGIVESVGSFENGYEEGVWKTFDEEDGSLLMTDTWQAGSTNGPFKHYYFSGELRSVGQAQKGFTHGEMIDYYEDGSIKKRSFYENGRSVGESVEYHSNGIVRSRYQYENGKIQGTADTYHSNGKLAERRTLKNGYLYGLFERYDVSGILVEKGNYTEKGIKEGIWYSYYQGQWNPNENGNLQERGNYRNNQKVGKWEKFHANGNPSETCIYGDNSRLHGPYSRFWKNGNIRETGQYENGSKTGVWKHYSEYNPGEILTTETF